MLRTLALVPVLLAACAAPDRRDGLPLLAAHGLDGVEALAAFEFADPDHWQLNTDELRGDCLELIEGSRYRPPHRSPLGLALLRAPAVADFDLEVEARQTGREYPHRDLCLVFAFQDAAHFAYAHLASAADASAHQVMLVDGADRKPVTTARTAGVAWGDGWHRLRLSRRGAAVRVWFDDAPEPVLVGELPPRPGLVGLGSFDDAGRFRALRLFGTAAPAPAGPLFSR